MIQQKQQDPEEQKRLFIAILLCGGILFGWQALFPPPPPVEQPADAGAAKTDQPKPTGKQTTERAAGSTPTAPEAPVEPEFEPQQVRTLGDSGRFEVEISDDGQISAWVLEEAQYRVRAKEKGGEDQPNRFVAALPDSPSRGQFLPPLVELTLDGKLARGRHAADGDALRWRSPQGVTVERRFAVEADGSLKVTVQLQNTSDRPVQWDVAARTRAVQHPDEAQASLFNQPIYLFEGVCERSSDFERSPAVDVAKDIADPDEITEWKDGVRWAGVDNRYFMTAAMALPEVIEGCAFEAGADAVRVDPKGLPAGLVPVATRLDLKGGTLEPGEKAERVVRFFAGPKKLEALRAVDPPLGQAIDFGMFSPICLPMLWLMRTFHGWGLNWGLAIILLTVLVKVLTWPLTHKQYESMAGMKEIQPQVQALQEKYKDDKMKLQQQVMELYKEHNVKPLAGCLPAVAMMPIYFALYRTIYSAVELFQAPFAFWIQDLSAKDPYFVTPVLLGVVMFVQTKLNPQAGDATQQKIMTTVMPVMFTAFMLFLPGGLVLYIFVNTVLGIAQQMMLLKKSGASKKPLPAKA